LNDHPTLGELQAFLRGDLDTGRVRAVVRHFLRGCKRCGTLLTPEAGALLGLPAAADEVRESAGAYDGALDRIFARFEGQERRLPEEAEPAVPPTPPELEALLDRCQALRYDDPSRMVELARFAAFLADRLESRRYGAKRVADLRCRAWSELANAYRVADRLPEAEETLEIAAECQVAGTGDELLGARLLEIQASLDADRRRFPEAQEALDSVYAVHLRLGDRHLAGRVLLKKGLYAGYDCDPEQAIRLLESGLALVDRERDPGLVFGALHNLAHSLIECGRLEEARELLRNNRFGDPHGRVSRLVVRWLEGRIAAGLGQLALAERTLEDVRRGFEELDLRYKAALTGLELAAVYLRLERADDARVRALEAVEVFSRLGVGRELLASVLVLRDAFERQMATAALIEAVIARLAKAEREPAA
jgi:tetratricopeptide (TPR) repeat protein